MNEIAQKLKQAAAPMALGWLMTVWLPVPGSVRHVVSTAAAAVINGAHAVMDTVQGPRADRQPQPDQARR